MLFQDHMDFVSAGDFCMPAYLLKEILGWRSAAYPFDWTFSELCTVKQVLDDDGRLLRSKLLAKENNTMIPAVFRYCVVHRDLAVPPDLEYHLRCLARWQKKLESPEPLCLLHVPYNYAASAEDHDFASVQPQFSELVPSIMAQLEAKAPVAGTRFFCEMRLVTVPHCEWPADGAWISVRFRLAANVCTLKLHTCSPVQLQVWIPKLQEQAALLSSAFRAVRTSWLVPRRPRVAVLLTGNVRTLALTQDLFFSHLIEPLFWWHAEVEIFWYLERHGAFKTWYEQGAQSLKFTEDVEAQVTEISRAWEKNAPSGLLLVHPPRFVTSEDTQNAETLHAAIEHPIGLNVVKQYKNLQACVQGISSKDSFTHLVKLRPDLVPTSPFTYNLSGEEPFLHFAGGSAAFVTDQFFYGTKDSMVHLVTRFFEDWFKFPSFGDVLVNFQHAPEHQLGIMAQHLPCQVVNSNYQCSHEFPQKESWLSVLRNKLAEINIESVNPNQVAFLFLFKS